MMGKQPADEGKLFYYNFSLESRIPARHVLRRIQETLDFSFAYEEVQDCYGVNGNVSVPPPVILKLMLLLFLYDVASERELLETLPYRLDWLWFCGYDIDSPIPDHSVLSKARRRWGVTVFETLFARVVASCVRAGLVDGGKIHVDGSLVEANASKNSIVTGSAALIAPLREQLRSETMKLDEPWAETPEACGPTSAEPDDEVETSGRGPKQRQVSTTDAEAAVVCRGHLSSRARYKNHRVVDDRYGVITATETTPGDVEENARLMALVDQHEQHTGGSVKTVVADAQYGTAANFQACFGRGIASHMGDLRASQSQKGRWAGLFRREDFRYDAATDTYLCPAGQTLRRRQRRRRRVAYEYACSKAICRVCPLRRQCTRAQDGAARTVQRHDYQEAIDAARRQSHSAAARRDRRRRMWRMEGSFGDAATQHGFKRSRWRGQWRQCIQDLLIATVQNLRLFLRYAHRRVHLAQAALLAWSCVLAENPLVLARSPR